MVKMNKQEFWKTLCEPAERVCGNCKWEDTLHIIGRDADYNDLDVCDRCTRFIVMINQEDCYNRWEWDGEND